MNMNFESCSSFWPSCGPRIRSLRFIDCVLPRDIIRHLVTHCINLMELSWTYEFVKPQEGFMCSCNVLDDLLRQKSVAENLISLEIHVSKNEHLSNYILNALFTLFPNIKKLALRCNSLNEDTGSDLEFYSKSSLSFACVLNKIKNSSENIENLRLELHYQQQRRSFAWETIVSTVNLTRYLQFCIKYIITAQKSGYFKISEKLKSNF